MISALFLIKQLLRFLGMVISAIVWDDFLFIFKIIKPGIISATNVIVSTVAYILPSDLVFME
jgi:hypothetical protein